MGFDMEWPKHGMDDPEQWCKTIDPFCAETSLFSFTSCKVPDNCIQMQWQSCSLQNPSQAWGISVQRSICSMGGWKLKGHFWGQVFNGMTVLEAAYANRELKHVLGVCLPQKSYKSSSQIFPFFGIVKILAAMPMSLGLGGAQRH
jgi:hypothetical protein